MQIEIKEVVSKRQLRRFADFPNKMYRHNAYYVPQLLSEEIKVLSPKKNPAFELCEAKYWFAYEGRKVVGRVAGIINYGYNQKTGKKYARFGWLDFIEKEEVLHALIQTVEEWARSRGAEILHGPLGFSDFDASGVLVEGFDELPTAYGKYNYPYYGTFLEKEGFIKETDWVEYNVKVPEATPEKYLTMASLVEKRYDLRCASLTNKKKLLAHADGIFELLNKAYMKLHGFSELNPGQLEDLKNHFLPMLQLKYVSVVLDPKDKVVAFAICLPSLSKALQKNRGRMYPFGFIPILRALRKNDTLDTLLIAIDEEYRDKGTMALMFKNIGDAIMKNGITNIETTRELEDNRNVQNLWNKLELRQHKRARCYEKHLIHD